MQACFISAEGNSRFRSIRRHHLFITLIALCLPALVLADTQLSGEQAFAACESCHSMADGVSHKVGPNLWGVYGRPAAQADGYNYSPALTNSGITWTRENLFAWIAASESLVPGSWMLFHNSLQPEEVMSLIDYLAGHGSSGDN
jgi:cytochrome c